jgi:hypothetical protein
MGKRMKTNMSGLVSHTTPNGRSYTSSQNKCEVGIKKMQKLLNEGWVPVSASKKQNDSSEFKMFGTIKVNFEIPVEILIKAGFRK